MIINVNVKKVGKAKNSISILPIEIDKIPENVRELIVEIVKVCVRDYNKNRKSDEILKNLTYSQIENMSEAGKILFGVNYGENDADLNKAIDNALLSFKDGIYRIFLNDNELTSLDEVLTISENSNFTFIRMTMLSGRLW